MTRRLLGILIVSTAALCGASSGESRDVIATVDGHAITMGDLEHRQPDALFQARNAFYDAEKKAINAYLDVYLLDRQAKKENLTVDQLLERHVNGKIAKDPTDDALRVYYEGLNTQESFDLVKGKIVEHLREIRIGREKTAYMQSLRSEAKISIDTRAPRALVATGSSPMRGAPSAPLSLIEFADYECPYCQQIQPDLDKAVSEYAGKINFVFKDFPLPMHAHAQKASEATQCAAGQNKYWEYHDYLFSAKQLDLPGLKAGAKSLGLDTEKFDACLDSGERAPTVKASFDEAQRLGLDGTPAFFLNGRFFSGALSYEQMRQIFEEELKATNNGPQTARR